MTEVSGERVGGRAVLALLVLPWLAPGAATQSTKPFVPPAKVDPYTGGASERLAALGYRSYGPFLFCGATTESVVSRLGDVPILWVETQHFRLGSALEEYRPEDPDPKEVGELKDELAGLAKLLDDLPARPRKLDPWLRLHLFARRLENLYGDLSARLALAPLGGAGSVKEKYCVLLTQKKSTLARFTREFCGSEQTDSYLYYFGDTGVPFFGIADESQTLGDAGLHYAMVHGVAQTLLDGMHGFSHPLPSWWQHGVALWFARRARPRILFFAKPSNEPLPPAELADWEPLVRGRVEGNACLGWPETLARPSWYDQAFGDNIVLWSRIDYLLQSEGVAARLAALLHARDRALPDSTKALAAATGLDLDGLDRAWRAWVLENYRKKRR